MRDTACYSDSHVNFNLTEKRKILISNSILFYVEIRTEEKYLFDFTNFISLARDD